MSQEPLPPQMQPGSQDAYVPAAQPLAPRHPYGNGRRVCYGSLWAFYTVVLVLGGFFSLVNGQVEGLVALVLGALTGRYAYRIWTWQARRLWFLIIF